MRLCLTRPRLMGLVMYRLPHGIRDCLTAASAAFRNGNQAVALATFLARFWSTPRRIAQSFPIDRRALANRSDLGLTEARIRGAIRVLEAIGFLTRKTTPGSSYRPTAGGLRRKPILYVFGADYLPGFLKANRRAKNSPKSKSSEADRVLMGERRRGMQGTEKSVPSKHPIKPSYPHYPGIPG